MSQRSTSTSARPRARVRRSRARRRTAALRDALAVAAHLAAPYPEEAAAIERVLRYLDADPHGPRLALRPPDVLLAASILLTASDREPTPAERATFATLDRMFGVRRRPPEPAREPQRFACRAAPPAGPACTACPFASTHPLAA